MPIYEYQCPDQHIVEKIRRFEDRDEPIACHCGSPAVRILSLPHCVPDGMYSYAPNVGSVEDFERRRDALRNGVKLIKKEIPAREE